MKTILILGSGTAGTMMASHLVHKIDRKNWQITVVERHSTHYYQPGFLFIPFGIYKESQVKKPGAKLLPKGVNLVKADIDVIDYANNTVKLKDGKSVSYDILIIATGAQIVPSEVPGLLEAGWKESAFDFYTIEGAKALRDKLAGWQGGKLVVHLKEMPVKCPVAPLEFLFLADWFFNKRKMRDKVEITYVTPLSGAFTKKKTSEVLGHLLTEKGIRIVTDFDLEKVDGPSKKLVSFEGVEVPYDLLVSIPTNMGDEAIARSGLGDDLRFVPADKFTLQAKKKENIFVIGDASDLPSSKAGSVAHFQAEVLTKNILAFMNGKPLHPDFDGHSNCFIESGYNMAFLIDFNYDTEPLPGNFPVPFIGPFKLLKETRLNHFGKMVFKWIYWNMLLKGIAIPGIPTRMSRIGKKFD